MARDYDDAIAAVFASRFKQAADLVQKQFIAEQKSTLKKVLAARAAAAYGLLHGSLLGLLVLEGKIQNAQAGKSPRERIRDTELGAIEIMKMVGEDLTASDPRHEFTVGILKHERGAKQKP